MAPVPVLAPLSGRVVALRDVPDFVFAEGIVGPGLAIEPSDPDPVVAHAPIAGRIVTLFPHAFAIEGERIGVLVHLGIDTVRMHGEGFELLAEKGAVVVAGEAITRWHPAAVAADGRSKLVPVIVLDVMPDWLADQLAPGTEVKRGDRLFAVGTERG